MKLLPCISFRMFFILWVTTLVSCKSNNNSSPSKELISGIDLKRGNVISCGPPEGKFGSVTFEMSCNEKAKENFNLAIELLHSFEYDEAEKVFAEVIDEFPECAMAYWGVAMSNFHALWTAPTAAELIKGSKAIEIAKSIPTKSARETAYINAIETFYKDYEKTDHLTRCTRYEKAMEQLHKDYPEDKETAIFYALALNAAANPSDKTFAKQKKAASLLNGLYPSEPDHPGIIHYIIHSYDYPGLAELALPSARKYAQVAPSSAHALHMPSHIFTRLGLWDECIQSNLASVSSAKCYAEQAGIKGHWDEELHGLDYLVYAYLQKGNNKLAQEQFAYLKSIKEIHPANFKVAYAFAAIPSRIFLENKNWKNAATAQLYAANIVWQQFPWQESLIHFTRLLGNAHLGNIKEAHTELATLEQLHTILDQQKDLYKSTQVAIQIKTGKAWIELMTGNKTTALALMSSAADMEDSTGKHPVTPGEVIPARELLGDMLLQMQQYEQAFIAYEKVLANSPNRFNSLYGAGLATQKSGNKEKAVFYYKQLSEMANSAASDRSELVVINNFLKHL